MLNRQIRAQTCLVDLPVAVLAPVEQDHGQPVAVFGPQRRIACVGGGVDVGGREAEAEFGRHRGQPVLGLVAQTTPGTRQQDYLMLHARQYRVP